MTAVDPHCHVYHLSYPAVLQVLVERRSIIVGQKMQLGYKDAGGPWRFAECSRTERYTRKRVSPSTPISHLVERPGGERGVCVGGGGDGRGVFGFRVLSIPGYPVLEQLQQW